MNWHRNLFLIAPAAVYAWFAILALAMVLLGYFPSSSLLWIVNLELVQPKRSLFYALDTYLGLDAYEFVFISFCGYVTYFWACRYRNRITLFLLSHLAALMLVIPVLLSGEIGVVNIAGFVTITPDLALLLPTALVCVMLHASYFVEGAGDRFSQRELLSASAPPGSTGTVRKVQLGSFPIAPISKVSQSFSTNSWN